MRLIQAADPNVRIGREAEAKLASMLDAYGLKVAKGAVRMARHAGRKTIKASDLEMVE